MITDVTGSTSYSYDANGHVTQKIQTAGAVTLTMTYGYDAGGRLASTAMRRLSFDLCIASALAAAAKPP
jgi:YD repeat-containing protein